MPILFPLNEVLDPETCYRWFESILWPQGRVCPRCGARDRLIVQDRDKAPLVDYECQHCRCIFNLFTGTVFRYTHRSLPDLYAIVRGIAQGVSTNQLRRELGCDYKGLLKLRHKIQAWIEAALRGSPPLAGRAVEADEMYQNAGEKRRPPHRSRRSAAPARQQTPRPRLLADRPRAGGRRG
jgi:transposase-like protein